MIVVDDDPVARAALVQGLDMAKALGAEVLFFHALPSYAVPLTTGDVMPLCVLGAQDHDRYVQERGSRLLAEAASLATAQAVSSRGLLAHGDDAAAAVAQAARAQQCDLIVVGSHGRTALQRLIHSSLAASLLPLATVPLLVCKARGHQQAGSVVRQAADLPAAGRAAEPGDAEVHPVLRRRAGRRQPA
jgi:nucleotide-binding universal stress UspA family protein